MTAPASPSPTERDLLLLCLDLQPVFLAAITHGQEILRRCSFAIEAAQGLGVPVVLTEQVPAKLGGTAPELLALAPTLSVLPKTSFSGFGDEAIATHLRASSARHLLLAGVETSICVYQTALDALRADYQVTILSDCVGARRSGDAVAALAQLARAGCAILPAESVFYALLGDARQPFFKSFTALVKKYG